MNLNRVFLGGNLTRDPEVRFTQANVGICNFGVAVNRKWKDANGQEKEDVTFVDCTAWGKTGELIGQYFTKGRPILVEGRLTLEQWEDKEGGKRSKLKVTVESFQFCGGDAGGKNTNPVDGPTMAAMKSVPKQPRKPQPPPSSDDIIIQEDDIPF